MKIHREIFTITKHNLQFLRYLYHHPGFTINEVIEEFGLKYSNLHNHLREWEKQGYITREGLTPELGGTKFRYTLSEKAVEELKQMKNIEF